MSSNLPLQVKEQWWGAELPPPRDDSVPQPQLSLWRPGEGKMEKGGLKKKWGGFKKRSPAAEARSLGRLLRWQEKLEPQLGPSRLQQRLRSGGEAIPVGPQCALNGTRLHKNFSGTQVQPCLRPVVLGKNLWKGDYFGRKLGAQATPSYCLFFQCFLIRENTYIRGVCIVSGVVWMMCKGVWQMSGTV